jgi:CRP/FNR family cyclic AMP-dependent transcriptional regulator
MSEEGWMQGSKPKDPSSDDVLSDAELAALSRRAIMRTFAKNTVVVSEGDRTDSLYIIVSGRVRVYVSDDQGKEIILSQAGTGEYFGEMVLDEGPRSASVITLEPTRFLVVPKEDFAAFLANSPQFALHLVRKLIRRVRALTHDVKSLALMDVYGRVARMLLDLAVERDGALVIEDRPTQQEMANRIGASREMISKILSELAAGGYIEVARDRITIARALPCGW